MGANLLKKNCMRFFYYLSAFLCMTQIFIIQAHAINQHLTSDQSHQNAQALENQKQLHQKQYQKLNQEPINPWQVIPKSDLSPFVLRKPDIDDINVKTSREKLFRLEWSQISQLSKTSEQQAFKIPLPDGNVVTYLLTYDSVMPASLAAKFPNILTFSGIDASNANNKGVFGINPYGFHGMFKHDGENIMIDAKHRNDKYKYSVYNAKDALPLATRKPDVFIRQDQDISKKGLIYRQHQHNQRADILTDTDIASALKSGLRRTISNNEFTTYRIAVSTTAEYTKRVGGYLAAVSEVNKALARVNQIYNRELNIGFILHPDNDQLIFTDSETDGFENNDNDVFLNAGVLKNYIDLDSIDLAHVLNTARGGLAYNGICNDTFKTRAIIGSQFPFGDVFYVSYIAHEIGHQLGAHHTFNSETAACAPSEAFNGKILNNRSAKTAWETLSGSTIMGYSGICGIDNLRNLSFNPLRRELVGGSSDFFHVGSLQEIKAYLARQSCGTKTFIANEPPIADAGRDHSIPAHTPFKLIGNATDANNDVMTFIWEQKNTGSPATVDTVPADDGKRPLFRSWEPNTSKIRFFPRLESVLDGQLLKGENYPTTNRQLNMFFTVRDGKGGVASDEAVINVVDTGRSFSLHHPNTKTRWLSGGTADVVWDTANTQNSPINCSHVDVSLENSDFFAGTANFSTPENIFKTKLATNVPNNGRVTISVPKKLVNNARVMVSCRDNVFFAVSDAFVITNQNPTDNSTANTPINIKTTDKTQINIKTTDKAEKNGGGSLSIAFLILLISGVFINFYLLGWFRYKR